MIPEQNVLPGKRSPFKRNVDVLQQANHGRSVDRQLFGVEHVAVVFLDAGYALEDHHHGAPLGAHVDGLEGSVQD